jgi:hypothetical protein
MDERHVEFRAPSGRAPRLLRRIALVCVAAPVLLATIGLAGSYLVTSCQPKMYGIGECMVGTINFALFLLVAVGVGLYAAVILIPVVVLPLLVVAWLLERRHTSAA